MVYATGIWYAQDGASIDTDEPDETSFRALWPKTFRLTMDVTETVSLTLANDT